MPVSGFGISELSKFCLTNKLINIVNVRIFYVVKLIVLWILILLTEGNAQETTWIKPGIHTFEVPTAYLEEAEEIPEFWVTTNEEVKEFLDTRIKTGKVRTIGYSAGGRPISAVFYGMPRAGKGTSTYSGSLGYRDIAAYRGPDHTKKVVLIMGGVHGGEYEPIMGVVNLLSVMETGKDLRGKNWERFNEITGSIDRMIIIPIMNPDGRNRVPIRMSPFRDMNYEVIEYWDTGGQPDGTITGWPDVKKHIPFDFKTPDFPGGYSNEAGVNIQHDDFMGEVQPETRILFDVTSREKPDIILNMHTGAVFPKIHRTFMEDDLNPIFDGIYTEILTGWTLAGFERTDDLDKETDPQHAINSPYNLNSALSFHCGALTFTMESPSHGFSSTRDSAGNMVIFTPDMLLDAQLIAYYRTLKYLSETGGLSHWSSSARNQ